jgi:hydroxyacylglutathione hydrolase
MRVVPVPQLMDNYAYLVIDESTRKAAVVDCAEAEPVLAATARESADLTAIWPTHHHFDHVGGNQDLLAKRPRLEVIGYRGQARRIPGCTREVGDGDVIRLGTLEARILFIPAHTTGHIAYYLPAEGSVFTGDTLFAGGCGRLFEGDAAMMLASLSKLVTLPDETRVYFGHEYTENNLRFAATLEPDNAELQKKRAWVAEQRRKQLPTTPTSIASEKATNPFLRWHSPELRQTLQRQFPDLELSDVAVFAKTRELKDRF